MTLERRGPLPPRRAPLKATKGLDRGTTPLPPGKPLERKTLPARTEPMARRGPGPRAKPRPAPRPAKRTGEAAAERNARAVVADRSGGVCEVQHPGCLGRASNVHHRKNQSQGGPWAGSNCLHVCGSGTTGCHGWITAHPWKAGVLGWALRRHQDPATEPVVYRDGLRYLLADTGDRIAVHHYEGTDDA